MPKTAAEILAEMADTSAKAHTQKKSAADILADMPDAGGAADSMPDALPEGVRIAGRNAAGGAIFAPAGMPKPTGGAARRFLSSAVEAIKQPIVGTWRGLTAGPQTPEEARIASIPLIGSTGLRVNRFLVAPTVAEAHKTAEEFRLSDPWSLHPSPEALRHRQLALGHGMATALPMLGPMAAQVGEKLGTQVGTGDIAGAMGTGAGNVLVYAAPHLLGKAGELVRPSIAKAVPKGMIDQLIKPMAGDVRFGKDPSLGLLREGITGNSLRDLGNKVSVKLGEIGRKLDQEAGSAANRNKVVDMSGALQPIDSAMAEAVEAGDRSLFDRLQAVRDELSHTWKPIRRVTGQIEMRKVGPRNMKMSPTESLAFKRLVGDRVRWDADPLTGTVNKALGAVYGKAKGALDSAVPAMKDLNTRYSDLVSTAKAIQRRIPVEQRNSAWSLLDIALAGTGHIPLMFARKALVHPAIRTRMAGALYRQSGRSSPSIPLTVTAPLTGAAASADELRDEAQRRRP